MSTSEETHSVVAPVVDPAAPAVEESAPAVVTEEPTVPVVESAEPAAAEPAGETAAVEDAAITEKASVEPANPIESGVLGYKAPGLIKSFKFSKKHFWLGGEEPVSSDKLATYLRGEKPEIAHPTAAWSAQTGKGLLYYAKHVEEKVTPAGVLNLAEASDLEKLSVHEFAFKLHSQKHTFKATNDAERDGWYMAIEKAITDAKVTKEDVVSSEGYKEHLALLAKPAAVAGGFASVAAGRKSTEAPKTDAPARAVSASSSDADVAAAKAKSRSASRGKRNSFFGNFLNKKEDHDPKKKEAEEAPLGESNVDPAAAPLDAEAVAARAVNEPVEDAVASDAVVAPAEEPVAVAAASPETAKKESVRPQPPSKRSSIFGSFFEKVRSPGQEKKESDVAPAVPVKDSVVSVDPPVIPEPTTGADPTIEAPAETIAVAGVAPTTEEAASKPDVATPKKEKESFFGLLSSKVRAKSPAAPERSAAKSEEAPAVPTKTEETSAPAAEESVIVSDAPAATEVPAEVSTEPTDKIAEKTTTPKESRRKSYFGAPQAIFRKASQAVRGNKESKKENITPAGEDKSASTEAPAETEAPSAIETTAAPAEIKTEEPEATGSVAPEAAHSVPVVSAAA